MKNMFVKGIVLGCLFLLMASCNTNEENSTSVVIDKELVKKDIQARENQFAEIYNGGELKKIGYYADDAVTFYQNMTPIRSKEERLEFLKIDFNIKCCFSIFLTFNLSFLSFSSNFFIF